MPDACFLYGSHASYATARTRSYLRKKGIPFVERLPSHPRFREDKSGWPAGSLVSKDADEPSIGSLEVTLRGPPVRAHAGLYPLWVLQRGLDWFASLSEAESKAGREPMIACDEEPLLDIQLDRRLTRVENRIALD